METRPPYTERNVSRVCLHTAAGMCTYDGIVLAAHDAGGAATAGTDTDDGDGRAVETNEDVYALDDDAEQAKEERRSRVARLSFRHKSV